MQDSLELDIRLSHPQDAPAIAKVLYESFVEYEALYTSEGFAATTPNADQIKTRMREGPVWIACRDDRVLGTVAAVMKGDSLYMRGMAVLPSARGSRVAARLLEQVEQWALDQGCRRVFLSTTPFLSAAIQLYERREFRRTNELPHDLFGTALFTMEKYLPRTK
jgi:N-acetylglutamate synthase-like GNAT family acetyltransferase